MFYRNYRVEGCPENEGFCFGRPYHGANSGLA